MLAETALMSTARTRTIVTAAVEFASTARVGWRGEERRLTVLCSGRSSTPEYDVVTCPASGSPGYYCNPEGGVFACMDWTAGSHKLQEQEEKFSQRTYVGSQSN